MVFDIPVNIHGVGGRRRFISATGKFFIRIEIPPLTKPRGALVSHASKPDYGKMIIKHL